MVLGILKGKVFKSQVEREKGSVLVELVMACLVLMVFFFACVEVAWLIRDDVYLQRVARDAAREAVLAGSLDAGYAKAADRAQMYFGSNAGDVQVSLERYDAPQRHSVTCVAKYPHRFFGWFSKDILGGKGVTLSAVATFGWWDFPQDYE
ncbi:TadE/TadG family type IV pilus assembly protein [Desulfovirgula thermocuniculi]|uniref:TadE/TadG family type IV pilus assembly protein n=1 Tax=Desulfovirgula thermocuniculi TaxID=348842 RepID=UPI0004885A04|nr:TadE/TadG family type IV pilus assembly protein [Desulfovirgula thermocuniculi]